jgi:hypothetical protein
MTDPIEKNDLYQLRDSIKEHVNTKISPIEKMLEKHDLSLYGKDGRNGIVDDVSQIKTRNKLLMWIASIGGASGGGTAISAWIDKIMKGAN